ncbi:MAG: hypothetical protein WCT40_00920 [Candidatus Magasanikbacteria bacterium]
MVEGKSVLVVFRQQGKRANLAYLIRTMGWQVVECDLDHLNNVLANGVVGSLHAVVTSTEFGDEVHQTVRTVFPGAKAVFFEPEDKHPPEKNFVPNRSAMWPQNVQNGVFRLPSPVPIVCLQEALRLLAEGK